MRGKLALLCGFFTGGYALLGALLYSVWSAPAASAPTISLNLTLILGAAIVVTGISFGIYLAWSIAHPLERFSAKLEDINIGGSGLIHWDEAQDRGDEIGDVARSFNRFTTTLSEVIDQVRSVTGAVSEASSQVSSSACLTTYFTGSSTLAKSTSIRPQTSWCSQRASGIASVGKKETSRDDHGDWALPVFLLLSLSSESFRLR